MRRTPARRQGFTLIEMLIVLLIVVLMIGFVIAIPASDRREEAVRGAAEQLAAVLRETRNRAMRKNTPYAVVFNIQNEPGSSGRILNNRSGGHWYRVLGPKDILDPTRSWNDLPFITASNLMTTGTWYTSFYCPPLQHYLSLIDKSWIDEPHQLPRGAVRFLALTDQDNGDNAKPSRGGWYTDTYPRPWFGWWDSNSNLLHAWGGYDPALKGASQPGADQVQVDGRMVSPSGFYYEGWDGEVVGCRHPKDRLVALDVNNNGSYDMATEWGAANNTYPVYRQGEPRPLINARWLDYVLTFTPDGRVADKWFQLRQFYWGVVCNPWMSNRYRGWGTSQNPNPGTANPYQPVFRTYDESDQGLADFSNGCAGNWNVDDYTASEPRAAPSQREATSFVHRTGWYWITLAPDVASDVATFPSAEAVLRTLTPTYRVGVSPEGQVKVIRVKNTWDGIGPPPFDTTFTGTAWQDKNKVWGRTGAWSLATPITTDNYINHELRTSTGAPKGRPIDDRLLPEMLRERKWWWRDP